MEQSGLYGEVNQQPSHSRVWALETLHRFSKLAPTFLSLLLGVRPLFALAPPGYAAAEAATTTTTTTTDTSPASSVTVPTFSEDQAASDSDDLFDEVWKLTSKFYLDRSFGGSDWGKARADLRAQSNLPGDSASETKATKKLLKKLGDKYTQLLSPYMYTEMSRFDPIGAGFMLSIDDDGYFCVSSDPREGSVAAAQNVQKGDKILEIEGVAIKGKSVFDAVDLITKEDKADVRLTIQSKLHPGTAPRLLVLPRDFNAVSNPGEGRRDKENKRSSRNLKICASHCIHQFKLLTAVPPSLSPSLPPYHTSDQSPTHPHGRRAQSRLPQIERVQFPGQGEGA